MDARDGFAEAVGNAPLIRLRGPSALTGCGILGPGHTVVTILADSGTRYRSKLFNPAFLREKGLPFPDWL